MNTTETKHTPLPWHVEQHQRYISHDSYALGGGFDAVNSWFDLIIHEDPSDPRLRTPIAEIVVSTEGSANSKLIVRAVNSHDALITALQSILELAHSQLDAGARTTGALENCVSLIRDQARAAIRQSTGGRMVESEN